VCRIEASASLTRTVKVIDSPKENLYTVPSVQTGPTQDIGSRQSRQKGKLKMVIKGGEPTKKPKAKAAPKKAAKKTAPKKK
jgi:hypothetical protein